MPRVAVPFDGVPDGQVHPRRFEAGDQVEGDLARVARTEGWLEKSERKPPAKKKAARKPAAKKAG